MHETIEGILDNIALLTKSQRQKIENDLDMLHLCRELATINCEVDVCCTMEEAILNIDLNKMVKKFEELELKNLNKILEI
jgi:5'-3' exonuclease